MPDKANHGPGREVVREMELGQGRLLTPQLTSSNQAGSLTSKSVSRRMASLISPSPTPSHTMEPLPTSSNPTPGEVAIAKHLQSLVYSMEDTVNERKFYLSTDADAPKKCAPTIWDLCSPFFQAEFEYSARCVLDLDGTLQRYREVGEGYPDFRIKILDVTTKVDESCGWATSFANIEAFGEFLARLLFMTGQS
ncbi:hypothetical protein M409DRAFT_61142 [Zasmidium cellare ATCC 36951]|uniref:Uncharacterized protein n=1 Tax=Zasmidium cellare ATCC 36951 TaxID=1080233 RepID=A0A6A6BWA0_ZASCE|nr:uncharacterized protein M409DRAFT_61142 [Zasmidium cellare ATCC 36951]KAF2159067.1 hypothetical protein M409DRAFT_61142 [Zasmidium cellare ATCC 36951]